MFFCLGILLGLLGIFVPIAPAAEETTVPTSVNTSPVTPPPALPNPFGPGAKLSFKRYPHSKLEKADLQGAHFVKTSLIRSELMGANLSKADLSFASLQGSDMKEANLSDAKINYANLMMVDLTGANLQRCQLNGSNLQKAVLQGANLAGASFLGAHLENVDFRDANLDGANFAGARFSNATQFPPGFHPFKHGMVNSTHKRLARGAKPPQDVVY